MIAATPYGFFVGANYYSLLSKYDRKSYLSDRYMNSEYSKIYSKYKMIELDTYTMCSKIRHRFI